MSAKGKRKAAGDWVATWATVPEFTGKGDMPKSGTLTGKSIRQIVRVSIGGNVMRLHLSNEYSKQPVEIKSIYTIHTYRHIYTNIEKINFLYYEQYIFT